MSTLLMRPLAMGLPILSSAAIRASRRGAMTIARRFNGGKKARQGAQLRQLPSPVGTADRSRVSTRKTVDRLIGRPLTILPSAFSAGRWAFVLVLLLAALAPAQSPRTAPASPAPLTPKDIAAAIAPYVDNQTLLVAHLDLAQVRTAELEKYVTELFDAAKLPADESLRQALPAARLAADAFLDRFGQLGGRHVYLLISQPDVWPAMQPLAVLLPVDAGADPQAFLKLVQSYAGPSRPEMQSVLLGDRLVFVGQAAPLQRLKTLKPRPRPEFERAFAAAPASPLQIAVTLTPDTRRVIAEILPRLPEEVGGGSTAFLSLGLDYLTVALELPPTPTLTLRAQLDTSANAQIALGLANRLLKDLPDSPDFKQALADPGPAPFREPIEKFLAALAPTAEGSTVRLVLDAQQMRTVGQRLVPAIMREYTAAQRTTSLQNLRDIAQACYIYSNDHKDEGPPTLDVLVKNKQLAPETLLNPADPKHRPYVYRPFTAAQIKADQWSSTPVVWEEVDDDTAPVNVAYLDAHSETLPNRKALNFQLAKTVERLNAK